MAYDKKEKNTGDNILGKLKKALTISDVDTEGVVELSGMEFFAYHGCLESERQEGNTFVVDVRFASTVDEAVESDNVADTLDYSQVYKIVSDVMAVPCNLIETVAGKIAKAIYTGYDNVSMVAVRVSKKNPPVNGACAWSRATVTCGVSDCESGFLFF